MRRGLHVLCVSEGSGGHLLPALETAKALAAAGHRVGLWYASRPQTAGLMAHVLSGLQPYGVEATLLPPARGRLAQAQRCWQLWRSTHRVLSAAAPDVIVTFGGWVGLPVVFAARCRGRTRPKLVLHEQNRLMGRANRLLARWVDVVATSFTGTLRIPEGVESVMTGLPVRSAIGTVSRDDAARALGLSPERPTLLVMGGSQGARAINYLVARALAELSADERRTWQAIHLTGPQDEAGIAEAYAAAGMRAVVQACLDRMELAYGLADAAISRAGAATLAELSRCGVPAVLIPYPFAERHQSLNASVAQAYDAGLVLDEREATAARLWHAIRPIMHDPDRRHVMGAAMRRICPADATSRLTGLICRIAGYETARETALPPVRQPSVRLAIAGLEPD